MATIITAPKPYSSINTHCIFDVERDVNAIADISINGYVKQMYGTLLRVNAAPYYVDSISITPLESKGGVFTAYDEDALDRVVRATISVDDVISPTVPLLLADKPIVANRFMTDIRRRFVVSGQIDEISVYCDKYGYVNCNYGGGESQIDIKGGVTSIAFRIPTITSRFTVDLLSTYGNVIDSIEYFVMQKSGVQLCWINLYGAIDFLNFPNRLKSATKITKERIYTTDGYLLTSKQSEITTTISTQALPEDIITGLRPILTSDSVWLVEDDVYTPIDIVSESAIIYEVDKLTALQIEYRNKIREI